jgi:hypothetical protein
MMAEINSQLLREEKLTDNYKIVGGRISGGAFGGVFALQRKADKMYMIGKRIDECENFGLDRIR